MLAEINHKPLNTLTINDNNLQNLYIATTIADPIDVINDQFDANNKAHVLVNSFHGLWGDLSSSADFITGLSIFNCSQLIQAVLCSQSDITCTRLVINVFL